ncbi:MAG: ABC transporter permease [Treponema sp.]|jgi:lipoprotein-releasing system permease protein|nr:ABC transporter permease [Treponema sp.]
MKAPAAFFIALRYLLGRAKEGGRYLRGAAVGIAISLIPIIVTLIVADGMIRGITDRFIELGTAHLQIYNHTEPGEIESIVDPVGETEGVRGVWRERRGLGVIIGKGGKRGATIRAVDPSFWTEEGSSAYLESVAGLSSPQTDREVVLGQGLAEEIKAGVGDTVRVMTILNADGRSIPRMTPFTVAGIVSSGYRELDALWCISTWEGGERALSMEQAPPYLLVKIDDPYTRADRFSYILRRNLGSGFAVYTWGDLQRAQYSSYASTRQMLLFIMALIVMVAAVNVSSATSMLVIERQRDIAVLKAAGASPQGTRGIFIMASFLTGLCGGALGIGLGLLLGLNINTIIHGLERILSFFSGLFRGGAVKILDPGYYLENIPIIVDWTAVFLIGLFTVLCSIIASWIPAYRAGKLKPLDLFRKY